MGYVNFDTIMKISTTKAMRDLPWIIKSTNVVCRECQLGKQMKRRFKNGEYYTIKLLELIHTDLCGGTRTKGLNEERYFMILIDDYSRIRCVTSLQEKSEAFEKFKVFNSIVENQVDTKIKCLRSDRGGEFTSNEFDRFCEKHGIRRLFFALRTPQ